MKIIESKHLSGGQLAGGNPTNERVEYDFYATNPKAVEMLLEKYQFNEQGNWLECCVGQGHIANVIENKFNVNKNNQFQVTEKLFTYSPKKI